MLQELLHNTYLTVGDLIILLLGIAILLWVRNNVIPFWKYENLRQLIFQVIDTEASRTRSVLELADKLGYEPSRELAGSEIWVKKNKAEYK